MQAIRRVEKEIKKAGLKGVSFWDNYGTLTAFDHNKIFMPLPLVRPFITEDSILLEYEDDTTYGLKTNNYYAGNSDDDLYYTVKK